MMSAERFGSRKKPSSAIPSLPLSRAGSGRFGLAGSAANSQRLNVKFEQVPTNIYRNETEEDGKEDHSVSKGSSMQDLRGMLSRGPSYRESTIIDSTSGKEIRVLVNKQQSNTNTIPSMPSTRQNSGGGFFLFLSLCFLC
jgi:hypothetical protein